MRCQGLICVVVVVTVCWLGAGGLAWGVRMDQMAILPSYGSALSIAMSPEGDYVAFGNEGSRMVRLYQSDGTHVWDYELPVDVATETCVVTKLGNRVVVGGQGSGVYVIKQDGTLLWDRPDIGWEVAVAATSDGDFVYAMDYNDMLMCFDGANGGKVWTAPVDTRSPLWGVWEMSVMPDGSKILLQTNSDVIICDALGVETDFFDVCTSNCLHSADLSLDGNSFAATYRDVGGTERYYVALYSITGGLQWSREIPGGGSQVCMDEHDNVLVGVLDGSGGESLMYDSSGTLLAQWAPGGGIACALGADRCAVGELSQASVYDILHLEWNCYPSLARPVAYVTETVDFMAGPDLWREYRVSVVNRAIYPLEMFDPSPDLPPCGTTTDASRSYITFYRGDGTPLYEHCTVYHFESMDQVAFPALVDGTEPETFYMEIEDRRCGLTYTSEIQPTCVCYPYLPDPLVVVEGWELLTLKTRYHLEVLNQEFYPDELFASMPGLGTCGDDGGDSRMQVEIQDLNQTSLRRLCGVGSNDELDDLWFDVAKGAYRPELVSLQMTDRRCGIGYASGRASLDHVCPTADLNNDCMVDLVELSIVSSQWLAGHLGP